MAASYQLLNEQVFA